jgi:hypothetical protein
MKKTIKKGIVIFKMDIEYDLEIVNNRPIVHVIIVSSK